MLWVRVTVTLTMFDVENFNLNIRILLIFYINFINNILGCKVSTLTAILMTANFFCAWYGRQMVT